MYLRTRTIRPQIYRKQLSFINTPRCFNVNSFVPSPFYGDSKYMYIYLCEVHVHTYVICTLA